MELETTVGVVAPDWLREPLAVLLQAAPRITRWAFETSVEALLATRTKTPPDLVLLYVSEIEDGASQVRLLAAAWPDARCIALVEHPGQQDIVKEAGADLVLPNGATPRRLLQALVDCA